MRTASIFGQAIVGAIAFVGLVSAATPAKRLLNADELLQRIEPPARTAASKAIPEEVQLLEDVRRFRAESAAMAPEAAARRWFELYDRVPAGSLGKWNGDYRAYDEDAKLPVGPGSLINAFPPPQSWKAFRAEATRRAARANADDEAMGLRLLTELLDRDVPAARASLAQFEALAAALPPDDRRSRMMLIAATRLHVEKLYGQPESIVAAMMASLDDGGGRGYGFESAHVPDLVGMLGEARATEILRTILQKPVQLEVEGDATRTLARSLALQNIKSLAVAQWGLASDIDAAELYEALQRRFGGVDAEDNVAKATESGPADWQRAQADQYYFLSLLVHGRQADAERMLPRVAGRERLALSNSTIEQLRKAGYGEQLYQFLHEQLLRRPQLRAWELYIQQAAYTGHNREALERIDGLLKRKDLPPYLAVELRRHRADALLAKDDVREGVALLRATLESPQPAQNDFSREDDRLALRLVGLGRVLHQPDLIESGLKHLRGTLREPAGDDPASARGTLLVSTFAELRRLGREAEAQELAIAELNRKAATEVPEDLGITIVSPEKYLALTELVSLYAASGQYPDALKLLRGSTLWGVNDFVTLVALKDSLGVPLAASVARTLTASGDKPAATRVALAALDTLPGADALYAALIDADDSAATYLDQLYSRDRFEERPLIWKAVLAKRAGDLGGAQTLIEQAIAIDPSDGEQGRGDRMKAYAVLADILEARGNARAASEYREAVAAIRISEDTDELHTLGLYQRAFAGYRAALDHFSDAYCIQSRLAVQLAQQGRREEALAHYRRAYELMPDSFGRVESHCFGCENVFDGEEQQRVAEAAFADVVAKNPRKPQGHYLLGYLREEQGRFVEALQEYRQAVALDPEYLNAWKRMHDLAEHIYIEADELDIARLKLLELDPAARHVHYELSEIGDFGSLWQAAERASASRRSSVTSDSVYVLEASSRKFAAALAALPDGLRGQMQIYQDLQMSMSRPPAPGPAIVLGRHLLVRDSTQLMELQMAPEME